MEIVVQKNNALKVQVGDIIQFEDGANESRSQYYYMICKSQGDGYFLINLSGEKSKMKFYHNISELVNAQKRKFNIYSADEYRLELSQSK